MTPGLATLTATLSALSLLVGQAGIAVVDGAIL